jgi:hypothetical protein
MMKYPSPTLGRFTALVVSLSLIGVAPEVLAQSTDVKSYSSAMCVADGGSVNYNSGVRASLSGTGYGTLLCPAIKDRYGSSYTQSGRMRVYDNNSSDDMDCYMLLKDVNGSTADWDLDSTSGTPGYDTLYFSVDGTTASNWDATLVFFCNAARSSTLAVTSYWVSEYNLYE